MNPVFDVRDYGAVPDGKTVNTTAFQLAVDACHGAGGGQVVCGAGTWMTGCIDLKSNVELHLQPGCRLVGSPSLSDYSPLTAPGFHPDRSPERSAHSLLRAVDAENIAVTGTGIIDGNGLAFYDPRAVAGTGKLDKPDTPRPRLLMFYRCRRVRLEGVMLVDSACWAAWLMDCHDVRIHRLTIRGNRRMRNGDGIDLDACRNVTVSDCLMDTEDDCLVLRAIQPLYDAPAVCENVTVTNCVLKTSCQGVRIGCPADGIIRNSTFSNLVIESTGNGILIENPHRYLPPGSKGNADVSNLTFANIIVTCRRSPLKILVEEGIALRRLSDLTFSGFRIHSGEPCIVQGSRETIVRNLRFVDMKIDTSGDDAFVLRRCRGVHFTGVEVSNGAGG